MNVSDINKKKIGNNLRNIKYQARLNKGRVAENEKDPQEKSKSLDLEGKNKI